MNVSIKMFPYTVKWNLHPPSTRVSLPNVLCGATLGVAAGCLWFTMSSPWHRAEKSSCLPFRRHPGGEKINQPRIQCPCGHLLCWPWPLPLTIPVVIKPSCPLLHLWKYTYSSTVLYSLMENFLLKRCPTLLPLYFGCCFLYSFTFIFQMQISCK